MGYQAYAQLPRRHRIRGSRLQMEAAVFSGLPEWTQPIGEADELLFLAGMASNNGPARALISSPLGILGLC